MSAVTLIALTLTPDQLSALVESAVERALGRREIAANATPQSDWITLEEAAAICGYTPDTMRKRKDIPFHRAGVGKSGRRRYRRSELDAFLTRERAA